MFSKKWLPALLIGSFLGTSCSFRIGEQAPKIEDFKIQGTGCLSTVLPVVKDYGSGKASDAEVAGSWNCAITALEKFKKYYRGSSADRFTSEELTNFLQNNFLDPSSKQVITPELRSQFMKFKQLFLGGSNDYLTRTEIDKTLVLLGHFKDISLRLNPYMTILAQHWSITDSKDVNSDIRYFESAAVEIQSATSELAGLITQNQQGYVLSDFVVFLKEFQKFNGESWALTDEAEKYLPLVEKIKKAIAGGDQAVVAPQEWRNFTLIGARGYLQYLRYYYFIKSTPESGSGLRLGYLARTVEDLLGAFQDLLKGKPTDPACGSPDESCISRQEVVDLLETFSQVWTQFRVSNKLIDQGLKLKQVYFGGQATSITSQDFERGKSKIASLKQIIEKFLPYYAVYSNEWDRSGMDEATAQSFFASAQKNLQSAAGDVGGLLESPYDLNDLAVLLEEVNRLYPNEKDPSQGIALTVEKYLPLLRDVKNIVFSENDTVIRKADWAPLLTFSSRFFSSSLYYDYFIKDRQAATADFLNSFKTLSDGVLDTVKDLVQQKQGQMITRVELDLVAQRLADLKMLPEGLDPTTVDQLVRAILGRLLWPAELRISGKKAPDGLTTRAVETARTELAIWYQTQMFALNLVGDGSLSPKDFQKAVIKQLKDPAVDPSLRVGLQEFFLMTGGPIAQTVDDQGRLIIGSVKHSYNFKSLAQMNIARSLGRMFIRASSDDLDHLKHYQGISLEEAKAFFMPIRPVFVKLGLIAPDNVTFLESRFRDASIFVAHATGSQELADFQQITDLVGMIISGVTLNGPFQKDVVAECLVEGTVIDYRTTVNETCLQKIYIKHMLTDTTATPDFFKYYHKIGSDEREVYFTGVLKAAGYQGGDVKLDDAGMVPHVLQYVEMIYARFDADHDGIINTDESLKAFPLFQGLLTELTKGQSLIKPSDLPALFTYILRYGKPPGGISDFLFKWLPWKSHPQNWDVAADRTQLAGILGYIADQASKSTKSQILTPAEEAAVKQDPHFKETYRH